MARRTVAYCDGMYIGIETIYTVIDGQQINIPEKLRDLRAKSRGNRLFCPCGCGSNLIFVAGDRNLREQHFRLKDGEFNQECCAVIEGKDSVYSKIVLKCWLDEKLRANDLESRVSIHAIEDTKRKYEFTFLSKERKVALSYCRDRVNLSDEKFKILEANSQGIRMIYVVDGKNAGTGGQYPEGLMKVQDRQGYCLFLTIDEANYYKARMRTAFYSRDIDGFWKEHTIVEGYLQDYTIGEGCAVYFKNLRLEVLLNQEKQKDIQEIEAERARRTEEEKHRVEKLRLLIEKEEMERKEQEKLQEEIKANDKRLQEENEKRRSEEVEKNRIEEEQHQAKIQKQDEDFRKSLEGGELSSDEPCKDPEGNRWLKCEFCGKIAKESKFYTYGGAGRVNLGTCYDCLENNSEVKKRIEEQTAMSMPIKKYDANKCPKCGGILREKTGKFGKFMGCSNYPSCGYTRKIK